jgi:hypothetical protein
MHFKHLLLTEATVCPQFRSDMDIKGVIAEAISLSSSGAYNSGGAPVRLEYGGVVIHVKADSDSALILRDYNRAMSDFIIPSIGPWPDEELDEQEVARDWLILQAKLNLAGAADLEVRDEVKFMWAARVETIQSDPVLLASMRYAIRWGRLMQFESNGKESRPSDVIHAACKAGLPTLDPKVGLKIVKQATQDLYEVSTQAAGLWYLTKHPSVLKDLAERVVAYF